MIYEYSFFLAMYVIYFIFLSVYITSSTNNENVYSQLFSNYHDTPGNTAFKSLCNSADSNTCTKSSILCNITETHCRDTLCYNSCIKSGFNIDIKLNDCNENNWKYCTQFNTQLSQILIPLAQIIKVYICTTSKLCLEDIHNINEDTLDNLYYYNNNYPNSILPLPICAYDHDSDLSLLLCKACKSMINSVDITTSDCNNNLNNKNPLSKRCSFVSDLIGNIKDKIYKSDIFNNNYNSICECLGCCRDIDITKTNKNDNYKCLFLDSFFKNHLSKTNDYFYNRDNYNKIADMLIEHFQLKEHEDNFKERERKIFNNVHEL